MSRLAIGLLCLLLWAGAVSPVWAYTYNNQNLENTDFAGQDLTDSSFTQSNLKNANFQGSDLHGISLFSANLEDANLEGANLTLATLDSARLIRANLAHANLEGAFAFNARFQGANIEGADFTDVDLRDDMRAILCETAKGIHPKTGRNTRDTLNCD
ncbi:MAG: pentapeptide repeat-containing protein [Thermosynechococcaceae cyanobacterium]